MQEKNNKVTRIVGRKSDDQFRYATAFDPKLEQWRVLMAEWVATLHENKDGAMRFVVIFLVQYIHGNQLETDPAKFLRTGYRAPCLYETCLKRFAAQKSITRT